MGGGVPGHPVVAEIHAATSHRLIAFAGTMDSAYYNQCGQFDYIKQMIHLIGAYQDKFNKELFNPSQYIFGSCI